MSLIIDLIIIIAAGAAIYLGYTRGFIKSVMHFASLIIALIAVFVFTTPLANWLGDAFINKMITDVTESSVSAIVESGSESLDLGKIIEEGSEALTEVVTRFSVDMDEIVTFYRESLSKLADSIAIDEIAMKLAEPTSSALSTALAAIIIFIGSLLILKLVTYILDMICQLPVLSNLNKFFGLLFGIGSAVVSAWVIANLSVALVSALESLNGDMFNKTVIDGSIILRFLYNNSLIFLK